MVEAGRQPSGERNGQNRLTEQQAREIHVSDRAPRELAKEYPTSASNVRTIQSGASWTHIHESQLRSQKTRNGGHTTPPCLNTGT